MRAFVIAGEASGDKLGAALMAGLKTLRPDVTFDGVGGPLMQDEGMDSRFPMDELSVMGLAEILPKYRALKARIRQMADAIIATRPDVLITIDSPDFCLRVARLVKAVSDIRTVHYVAPTVWAWRPGRAEKMARHIDHVLALFPFEPPYMQAAGMDCDFVGHPVKGEVSRLADRFGDVVEQVATAVHDAHFVVPTTSGVYDLVSESVAQWSVPVTVLPPGDDTRRAYFKRADVALAASGTVSLELAANGTPMVIAYDMAWLSRIIIGRMLRVDTVTLVNLVSETRDVPEFIGKDCEPGPIAQAVHDVLVQPDAQRAAMEQTMQRLGLGGDPPELRAAQAVLDRFDKATVKDDEAKSQ